MLQPRGQWPTVQVAIPHVRFACSFNRFRCAVCGSSSPRPAAVSGKACRRTDGVLGIQAFLSAWQRGGETSTRLAKHDQTPAHALPLSPNSQRECP